MPFFAVGTNMDEARLRAWVPSAQRLGIASLGGHRLGPVAGGVVVVGEDGVALDATVYVPSADVVDESVRPRRSYLDPIVDAA